MNWIDVTLILTAGISLLSGLRQGLSRTGLGLIAVGAGFLAGAWLYPTEPVPFLLVFVGVVAAGWLACRLLGKWLESLDMPWLDKPLGGALGLVNGILCWVLMVFVLMSLGARGPREQLARSEFVPYALDAAWSISETVPEEMKTGVRRSYEELQKHVPRRYRNDLPQLRPSEI